MPKPGDRVSITTADETLVGTLMPEQDDFIVLKLDSGYNMGIAKKSVKGIKTVAKHEERKEEPSQHTHMPGLPLITILHTGGTIASKVDYETGGVVARYSPAEILQQFPELAAIANIESRLVRNMFSEDMRFGHYNILAKEIEKEIARGAHAVLITHGTDTLHFTAAALSFLVRPLPIPIILIGAQRSSDRPSSDAAQNLLAAAHVVTKTDFAGVGVCMHAGIGDDDCVILPGLHCRKLHSSRRDAFKAVNAGPLARVNPQTGAVRMLRDYPKRQQVRPVVTLFDEKLKVGMLLAHPHMHADDIKCFAGYDGLVLAGTGLGHLPVNEIDEQTKEHPRILRAVAALAKEMPVVMTTQTIFGTVDMDVYTTGRKLQEAGVLGSGRYLTTEVAFIKLAWLLSNHKNHVKEHWDQDICGEFGNGSPDGVPW